MPREHVDGDAPRVRGAGLALAYELTGPADSKDGLPALLCLHGNSSHRGIWRLVARDLGDYRCALVDMRGHGDSAHVDPPAYNPEDHAADIARVVSGLGLETYAILAHSAGALAAARFIAANAASATVPAPAAFVWVDIDPLVPRWQVDYFNQGTASVARLFPDVEDALRGFRRIYPNVPEDRLRSFVAEGSRPAEGGWRMKAGPCHVCDLGAGRPAAGFALCHLPHSRPARRGKRRQLAGRRR